jgi:hypothetical protein
MARYIATINWTSGGAGNVFAVSHPGGLLLTPLTMRALWIEGARPRELRALVKRYNTLASGGTSSGTAKSFDDGAAASKAEILFGAVAWPNEQALDLAVPTRLRTRGARENVFDLGTFTVGVGHSMVVELLDGDAMAAPGSPLMFALAWDE